MLETANPAMCIEQDDVESTSMVSPATATTRLMKMSLPVALHLRGPEYDDVADLGIPCAVSDFLCNEAVANIIRGEHGQGRNEARFRNVPAPLPCLSMSDPKEHLQVKSWLDLHYASACCTMLCTCICAHGPDISDES